MSSTSSLGAVAAVLTPRHRHLSQTRIMHCDPDPSDSYAPAPKGARCCDSQGYRRKRHEWLCETRRGTCCVWCGAVMA